MRARRLVLVFIGGGLGACVRAALLAALASWNAPFPSTVLLINLVGSCLLGVIYVLADEAELLRVETRLFLAVGVLGGFTTFSTFVWGADQLLAQPTGLGVLYVLASAWGGVTAAGAGVVLGRELVRLMGRAAPGTPIRRRVGSGPGQAARDIRVIDLEDEEETG